MSNEITFNNEYYKKVITEYGYDPFSFSSFNFDIGTQSFNELNTRYLCHQEAEKHIQTPKEKRIITTGLGMSGIPHLGSISQIVRTIRLQEDGENCQIVLGDLDAYNGRNKPLSETKELAAKFKVFVKNLGFDAQKGILRDQYKAFDELRTMYLIAQYANDDDFNKSEEDLHDLYSKRGLVDNTMTLRRKLSLLLMTSDFITLGQKYDNVLVMLGLDEHQYVLFSKEIHNRISEKKSSLRSNFNINAIYTKLTNGLNGHPKMSKSIPESSINVITPPEKISELLMNAEEPEDPEESVAYQLMLSLYTHTYEQSIAVKYDYAAKNNVWINYKKDLIERVIDIVKKWPL